MHVVASAASGKKTAGIVSQDSPDVLKETWLPILFYKWFSVFGAEDDMNV
jgi:hypothetical protein